MKHKKININQIPSVCSYVSSRTIDGYEIIIDIKSKTFHRLNKTGSVIFQMAKSGRRINEITRHIVNKFDVPRETAEKDCLDFISVLCKNNLMAILKK